MSKVFICVAIPDELATREEGTVVVATTIETGDERHAQTKFHWQPLEHYPAAQNCTYKFIVYEDKPGTPRPALDSRGAEYMQEDRWDEGSASFVLVETEPDPMNVTFDKLAPEVQNAIMVKFDTCENITADMVVSAQELLREDMAIFDGHIIEALVKMPEVNAMYPELKLHAIGWVKYKRIPGAERPEIQAEMHVWKERREGERKETRKYTSVVDLTRAKANQQYTENSAGKINPIIAAIHRKYKQTWKTLDGELAYALWPGDIDAGSIDDSIHRWAKNKAINNDHEDWKRISASMHRQPDALRYDRQTIFGLVRERPIDIRRDPVALDKYVTEYLTAKGVSEDEGTSQSATDTLSSPMPETDVVETVTPDNEKIECKVEVEPPAEREGPFYFLFTDKDGGKYSRANKLSGLDKALSAGATEITKEEYFARRNGTYSDSQQNTGTSDTTAQPGPVKVTADGVNKIMQAANISQSNTDELLTVSRGEFVEGISDPNGPKWIKGTQTHNSVNQSQQETEQNDQRAERDSPDTQQNEPETRQPEPVVRQEPEKICTACDHSGGGNCPDCGTVVGDATYQETFGGENQPEVQENDPGKMEGTAHQHKENTGNSQRHNSDNETGETVDHLIRVSGHHEITSTGRTCGHLTIDLGTIGRNPGAPIISIGAIFFDSQIGDIGSGFSKTIDLGTAGGVIGRDTIKWWLKQSCEAQSATMTDEIPLNDALLQLRESIDENSGESFAHVWGNGANFDNTILRHSYERQEIPCPWRYYNDRDVRTAVGLGEAIGLDAGMTTPFEGERHNALDDARYQAKYVSAI